PSLLFCHFFFFQTGDGIRDRNVTGVQTCDLPILSDPLMLTAQAVETITRKEENKLRRTLARLEVLAKEYEVSGIVIGLPKNMNNTIGDRAEKTMAFGAMVERRTGLKVVYWDERMTTISAERVLIETGVRREHRKDVIDQIAAGFILQGYLESRNEDRMNE